MWNPQVPYPKFDGTQNCADMDTQEFYYENEDKMKTYRHNQKAKQICNDCFFLAECLTWGVYEEQHGIWGGTTPLERANIRKKLNIKIDWRLKRVDFDRATKE